MLLFISFFLHRKIRHYVSLSRPSNDVSKVSRENAMAFLELGEKYFQSDKKHLGSFSFPPSHLQAEKICERVQAESQTGNKCTASLRRGKNVIIFFSLLPMYPCIFITKKKNAK